MNVYFYFNFVQRPTYITKFGSGCSSIVTQATLENRKGGKRTFIGFFDPSVRPYFEAEKLSYTRPMSRGACLLRMLGDRSGKEWAPNKAKVQTK